MTDDAPKVINTDSGVYVWDNQHSWVGETKHVSTGKPGWAYAEFVTVRTCLKCGSHDATTKCTHYEYVPVTWLPRKEAEKILAMRGNISPTGGQQQTKHHR